MGGIQEGRITVVMITLDMNNERYDITQYDSIITYVTITHATLCETINLGR